MGQAAGSQLPRATHSSATPHFPQLPLAGGVTRDRRVAQGGRGGAEGPQVASCQSPEDRSRGRCQSQGGPEGRCRGPALGLGESPPAPRRQAAPSPQRPHQGRIETPARALARVESSQRSRTKSGLGLGALWPQSLCPQPFLTAQMAVGTRAVTEALPWDSPRPRLAGGCPSAMAPARPAPRGETPQPSFAPPSSGPTH